MRGSTARRNVARLSAMSVLIGASLAANAAPAFAAGGVSRNGSQVTIAAATGVANVITVYHYSDVLHIKDENDTLTAGSACSQVDARYVRCPSSGVTRVRVEAGDGDDTVVVSTNTIPATIEAGPGDDHVSGGAAPDVLYGGPGVDTLRGHAGNDWLVGGPNADFLVGGAGNDVLLGEAGDDRMTGDAGNDTMFGGPGDDQSFSAREPDGADTFYGDEGDRDLVSYQDRVAGVHVSLDGIANDGAPGERDNVKADVEWVHGGNGGDTLVGNASANVLLGAGSADSLMGEGGNDILLGGVGSDQLWGGPGDDTFPAESHGFGVEVGDGADRIKGESGVDTVDYRSRTSPVWVTLNVDSDDGGLGEHDYLDSIEVVLGGSGDDTLTGDSLDQRLDGGPGDDTIDGMEGDDTIVGGPGFDRLLGGAGYDTLHAVDGQADELFGGTGRDACHADGMDRVAGCEE